MCCLKAALTEMVGRKQLHGWPERRGTTGAGLAKKGMMVSNKQAEKIVFVDNYFRRLPCSGEAK